MLLSVSIINILKLLLNIMYELKFFLIVGYS